MQKDDTSNILTSFALLLRLVHGNVSAGFGSNSNTICFAFDPLDLLFFVTGQTQTLSNISHSALGWAVIINIFTLIPGLLSELKYSRVVVAHHQSTPHTTTKSQPSRPQTVWIHGWISLWQQ